MTNKEKTPKSQIKKGGKFLAITTFLICFALCITLADLFSTFITVGSYSNISGGKVNAYSIYAIYLHQSSIKSSALEQSNSVKKMGGAGYVWEQEGVFYVIASAYIEENDAKKVKENLAGSSVKADILKITFDEITISREYSTDELSKLINAISVFKNTYKTLYDISISLDTSILTETQCRLEVSNLHSEVNKTKSDFEALFNPKLTPPLLKLKLSVNSLNTLVQQLIDFNDNNLSYNSKIKYNYMEILWINKTLSTQAISI
ncbi:MAG: hypothetical protein PHX09_03645 [Clostridia bacterium]|nr:hypothetical protein [Clostridia bacterium]MDD4685861.1 hypothetical protein [Clostridia bacterium]